MGSSCTVIIGSLQFPMTEKKEEEAVTPFLHLELLPSSSACKHFLGPSNVLVSSSSSYSSSFSSLHCILCWVSTQLHPLWSPRRCSLFPLNCTLRLAVRDRIPWHALCLLRSIELHTAANYSWCWRWKRHCSRFCSRYPWTRCFAAQPSAASDLCTGDGVRTPVAWRFLHASTSYSW